MTAYSNERKNIALFGEHSDDKVQLYWEIINWPKGVVGFKISKFENNSWKFLRDATIYPHFNQDRDWSAQGFDEKEYKSLDKKLKEYILAGKMTRLSKEDLLARLEKYGKTGAGFRIKCKRDNFYKMFSGFYYVDHLKDKLSANLKYGLHFVYKGGRVDEKPQSIEEPQSLKQVFTIKPLFKVLDQGTLQFEWTITEETLRNKLLNGQEFNYNSTDLKSKSSNRFEKNNYVYSSEISVNTAKSLDLEIIPTTIFGSKYSPTKVNFDAEKYLNIGAPVWKDVLVEKPEVKLSWSIPEKYKKAVKKVSITFINGSNFTTFGKVELLGYNTSYSHKPKNQKIKEIFYRLEVESFNGQKIKLESKRISYFDPDMPPKVTGLKAVYNKKTKAIDLSWDKIKGDTITTGYRLWVDEIDLGHLRESSGVGTINKHSYSYKIGENYYLNRKSRDYTIQIQPMGPVFSEVKSAGTVVLKLPILYLEPPYSLNAKILKSTDCKITWDYYKKDQYTPVMAVTGYKMQIYKDLGKDKVEEYGKPIFLKPDDPKENLFVSPSNDDKKELKFQVRMWALAGDLVSEKYGEVDINLSKYRASKNLLKGTKVSFAYDKKEHVIRYTWKFPEGYSAYKKNTIMVQIRDDSKKENSFSYSNVKGDKYTQEGTVSIELPKDFKRDSVNVSIRFRDTIIDIYNAPIIRAVKIK